MQSRRPRIARLLLALLLLPSASMLAAGRLALAPGDRVPGMRGKNPHGEMIWVDYAERKINLINFWATWCQPCVREMPALQDVLDRRGKDGLQVYGIVRGGTENDELVAFLEQLGVSYPVLRLAKRSKEDWGGMGTLPASFLVDSNGRLLRRYIGATEEQIEALIYDIEAALDDRPLGPFIVPERPEVATEEDRIRALEAAQPDEADQR